MYKLNTPSTPRHATPRHATPRHPTPRQIPYIFIFIFIIFILHSLQPQPIHQQQYSHLLPNIPMQTMSYQSCYALLFQHHTHHLPISPSLHLSIYKHHFTSFTSTHKLTKLTQSNKNSPHLTPNTKHNYYLPMSPH